MTDDVYTDVQKLIDSQVLSTVTYQVAAQRILEELDARGFTTDNPEQTTGLRDKITNIIKETVQGNTNYCVTSSEGDGWDGDLQNQGPPDDDYPPTHPLEN